MILLDVKILFFLIASGIQDRAWEWFRQKSFDRTEALKSLQSGQAT